MLRWLPGWSRGLERLVLLPHVLAGRNSSYSYSGQHVNAAIRGNSGPAAAR